MDKSRKAGPLARFLVPVLAGMVVTTAIYQPSYIKTPVCAWWGTMYPQYCFSQDVGDAGEAAPVKIAFRWLHIK